MPYLILTLEEELSSFEPTDATNAMMELDLSSDSENETSDGTLEPDSDSESVASVQSKRVSRPWHLQQSGVSELKRTREVAIKEMSRRVSFI